MIAIHRYVIRVADKVVLEIPGLSRLLDIGHRRSDSPGELQVWALVDTDSPKMHRQPLVIRGTGHPVDEACGDVSRTYWKTVQAGMLVWHIFKLGSSS